MINNFAYCSSFILVSILLSYLSISQTYEALINNKNEGHEIIYNYKDIEVVSSFETINIFN